MKLEVLLSTMNQKGLDIFKSMNIQTDAIIINQTDKVNYTEEKYKNKTVRMFSFRDRGIGISRNNALMRSDADICLMADDDMVYEDDYKAIVINAFKNNPKADFIIFNVPIYKKDGSIVEKVKKNERVRFYNGLKYGTVNFAFKREAVLKKNMMFSILFGASRYGSGEDSLFLVDALKNKLKVYTCTDIIAKIKERKSSWMDGYNEKYFFDRGALFKAIGGRWSPLLNLQFVLRHRNKFKEDYSIGKAFSIMQEGSRNFMQ